MQRTPLLGQGAILASPPLAPHSRKLGSATSQYCPAKQKATLPTHSLSAWPGSCLLPTLSPLRVACCLRRGFCKLECLAQPPHAGQTPLVAICRVQVGTVRPARQRRRFGASRQEFEIARLVLGRTNQLDICQHGCMPITLSGKFQNISSDTPLLELFAGSLGQPTLPWHLPTN